MQRQTDGWHLELVAFGAGRTRADEKVAALGSFKELRQIPLKRDGWERREFGLSLDSKGGHEQLPIHITALAYAAAEANDFVPDLSSADGVLVLASGDATIDARVAALVDAALAKRPGGPPHIVERSAGDSLKDPLRNLVKRAVKALKAGELLEFWKESVRSADAAHDADVFGPLTKDKILGQREGELVAFLLRLVHDRARRAVAAGRVPTSEAYERCMSARWQRLLAVNALEMLVADVGVVGLFGAPSGRAMEREEVTVALAGLKRIGAPKKAAIIERALVVAREARLWEGAADDLAAKVLEELTDHFYAVDDEPLSLRLEADIRKAPEDFTLGAYED
jgi:hypothetical protein